METIDTHFTCTNCPVMACRNKNSSKPFPPECLTTLTDIDTIDAVTELYKTDDTLHNIAIASAEVEGGYYGTYTRVEEIMAFARGIGANKIGVATCVGLMKESQIFARILRDNDFEVVGVACKIGAVGKADIGIDESYIKRPGECICNPVLQAKTLNAQNTELNVVVGLCVGHDSMFYMHAEAPCTTLITKDRVTGHNPAAALYTAHSYSAHRFKKKQ